MAETIDELLVKLGLETDAKSFQKANNEFTNLRTAALTMGAAIGTAVLAAGVGIAKMSDGVARSVDGLGKWAAAANVNIQKAQQWAFALEKAGSANPEAEMMSMFDNINKQRDLARMGNLSEDALEGGLVNGYAIRDMGNEQAAEFFTRQISAIKDKDAQRRVATGYGFSSPAQLGAVTNYDRTMPDMRRAEELGNADQELFENAAAYMDAMTEFSKSLDGFRMMVANEMLPVMTEWIKAVTGWMAENKSGAKRAVEIVTGPGTNMQKATALYNDPEVGSMASRAWEKYKDWNIIVGGISRAIGSANDYTKEATGATIGERWEEATRARAAQQMRYSRSRDAGAPVTSDEMNYKPSSSELIPQSAPYMPASYPPDFSSRSAPSSGNSLTINVDASGSADPGMTADRVAKVVRKEVSRLVETGWDEIGVNVV